MQACIKCGECALDNVVTPVRFKNDSTHLKLTCATCGHFLGYKKQDNTSFKDELFRLVMDLSIANASEFNVLALRAKALMRKTVKE